LWLLALELGPGLKIVLGEGVVGVGKGDAIGAFPTSRGMGDSRRCRGRIESLLVLGTYLSSNYPGLWIEFWSCGIVGMAESLGHRRVPSDEVSD
jgi:hypothetical protein